MKKTAQYHLVFCFLTFLAITNSNFFANESRSQVDLLNEVLFCFPASHSAFVKFNASPGSGNLVPYQFETSGYIAAETLKQIKVIGELRSYLGDLSKLHIVEMGGGQGDLCRVFHELGGFASYTIVNDQTNKEIIRKNLLSIDNVTLVGTYEELDSDKNYDLILGHCDLIKKQQVELGQWIEKLNKIPRGCLIGNFSNFDSISSENLIALLRERGISGVLMSMERKANPNDKILILKSEKLLTSRSDFKRTGTPDVKRRNPSNNAVTYCLSGGRLGDNIISYLHAKWLSYRYGLDLIITGFPYSDQFMLDELDLPSVSKLFVKNKTTVDQFGKVDMNKRSTLFEIPYFPEGRVEYDLNQFSYNVHFPIPWDDQDFKNEIKKVLSPKDKQIVNAALSELPKDRPVIGVHVRTGIGFDSTYGFIGFDSTYGLNVFPMKFLPLSYYIEQIRRISEIYHDQPLYAYLFTDSPRPEEIISIFEKQLLEKSNITFIYRTMGNNHDKNVLLDFFKLANCDCLIRGDSNFAIAASKIADYKVTISPAHRWENDRLIFDRADISFKPDF